MKRARFDELEYGSWATFEEWMAQMMHTRRGEAAYVLQCEWRRAFGVDAKAPFLNLTVECLDGERAFRLVDMGSPGNRFAVASGDILLYARTEQRGKRAKSHLVTMYHPALPPVEYTQWRLMPERRSQRDALSMLGKDIFRHLIGLLLPADAVHIACTPLCKAWIAMWESYNATLWTQMHAATRLERDCQENSLRDLKMLAMTGGMRTLDPYYLLPALYLKFIQCAELPSEFLIAHTLDNSRKYVKYRVDAPVCAKLIEIYVYANRGERLRYVDVGNTRFDLKSASGERLLFNALCAPGPLKG